MPKQTFFNLPGEKQAMILDRAIDEFAEYGYEKSSINRIVEASAIAKGSFYQYFADKFDLYEHIITVMIADPKMASYEVAQRAEALEQMPFFDLLRAMFRRNVAAVCKDPRVLKIGVELMNNHHADIYKRIMGPYGDLYNTFYHSFIEAKKRTGEIRPEVDSWALNYMLLGMSENIISLVENKGANFMDDDYPDWLVDALEEILVKGIFTDRQPT